MDFKSNKIVRVTLLVLLQLVCRYASFGAGDPVNTQPLLGSQGNVQVNKESFVSDYTFFNPLSPIEATHVIKNQVSVGIEEESKYFIQTDFTATVVLHITKYNQSHQLTEAFDKTFVIGYKKAAGSKNTSMQFFPFENAYEVRVKIISITPGSGVTWDVSKVLRVDNTLTATRDYVFDCSKLIVSLTAALDVVNNELTASWADPACGQTEYDLEWAWIDETAIENYKDATGNFSSGKIFTNNATRVTLSRGSTSYNIPLLYDGQGRVFVRVRPAQIKFSGQRIEGTWAWQNANTPVAYAYKGHENLLNWQASTSYAEEGKRKSVVQYFDGTLRNRQTVTKDNSTNTTIVAESFYDYQGRPVIQVLPAPTLSNIIHYSQNFNKAVNYDGYPKWAYDQLNSTAGTCANPAAALSTTTGTAKYYSPANEKVNTPSSGYNPDKYIPNAEGPVATQAYPFTETRFAPDGRLAAQGGVGYSHQLGSGHETKYLYEPPAQEELDALFGTEAGVATHYFKNLVKDANGQYSVSYTDMHGRTVATALAGYAPAGMDSLTSINTKNFTKQLIDEETNRVLGKSIISTKPLVVPMAGLYTFTYQLNPAQLSLLSCTNQPICYDCLYNLTITVAADCSNLANFSSPFILTDSNFTLGQSLTNPVCNAGGKTKGFFNKYFQLSLPEGSYTITKTLTLSDSAQNAYREVFIKNDTCRTLKDFYDKEYQVLLAKSNCAITCASCTAALGADFTHFRQNFVVQSGMAEPLGADTVKQLQAAYNEALANCSRLCNKENKVDDGMEVIRSIKQMMLQDVTPPFGQYAQLDNPATLFNVLNPGIYDVPAYLDPFGTLVTPSPATSIQAFADNFQPSWADQLLPYHPEYPKLQVSLQNLPATYQFEANLTKTTTWQAAAGAGYINNILALDPFFNGAVAGNTANAAAMAAKMKSYAVITSNTPSCAVTTISSSMWQLAQSVVFCKNVALSPPCNTAQGLCLLNMPSAPPLNPTTGCATDWDMVWQTFRSLYLTERKKLISKYIIATALPNNDQVIKNYNNGLTSTTDQKLQLRFINFNDVNSYTTGLNAGDLTSFFSALSTGDPSAPATAQNLATAQYTSTCRGYTDMWLAQLALCPAITARWDGHPGVKSADSVWLTDRLVKICQDGSDEFHYLGASTAMPSKTGYVTAGGTPVYREFPEVIKQFLLNTGIPVADLCHPYLLTAPAPYDKQAAVTNEVVMTKPADCACTQLATLKNEYVHNATGYATFSAYLKARYGTDITQGALDTLASLCNGSYTCVFLPVPIMLPPVLQCHNSTGTPVKACISCSDFKTIQTAFYTAFHQQAPVKYPRTQSDIDVNTAFVHFANYTTGFNKNISDYLSFADNCGSFSCDSLQNIISNFIQQVKSGKVIHTLQTQEGQLFNNLSQITDTGTIHLPDSIRVKPGTWYNNYNFAMAYGNTFCTNNGYSVAIRFKFLENTKTGDVFYSGLGLAFTVQRYTSGIYTGLSTIVNGVRYVLDPDPAAITHWMLFKVKVLPGRYYLYYNNVLIVDYARDPATAIGNQTSFAMGLFGRQGCIDYVKVYDNLDNLQYFEDFNNPNNPAFVNAGFVCNTSADCSALFTNYFNQTKGTSYSFAQIDSVYFTRCGIHPTPCQDTITATSLLGPVLCGLNKPLFDTVPYDDNPCKDLPKMAYTAAEEKWQLYNDSLHNVFDTAYYNKCMGAKNLESFTVNYNVKEYHYTLYYYDQAGNLVKTVPPAGVDDRHGDAVFLQNVKDARARVKTGEAETLAANQVWPLHTMVTAYRYNTLNQVVAQKTPDAGQSRFWYDALGRLAVSQNARQANALNAGGKKYSYTIYDILGRISEVGQKPQTADPANSKAVGGLTTWLAGGGTREQITRTSYDLSYSNGTDILTSPPSILVQRNLRNRVSYSLVYDSDPGAAVGTQTAATYYTYDIHGNVDTLLQDLRVAMLAAPGNRYKKIVYNYDLISGKVNKVSYQPGLQDEFYHQYNYDPENRLTEVYTSPDNLVWEKDARYSYYRHGPLARTIVGQQQVQGIDYAYTLQGWLKGVNSTGVQKEDVVIGNGQDCGNGSAVEDLVVNARVQPYSPQYVARTSITLNPGFESITADDFTAYIDNTLSTCANSNIAGTVIVAPVGNSFDIGTDGVPVAAVASQVANDAYGFNLNYFTGDYKPINSAVAPFAAMAAPLPGSGAGGALYNGNISSMAVNIPRLGDAQLYGYRYDQLNRLVAMDAFTGFNPATNQWSLTPTQSYKERVSYDPNGNIKTYSRNGNAARLLMDNLSYKYITGTNKLDNVTDAAPDAATGEEYAKYNDIKRGQAAGNYNYDETGNLVADGTTAITWNVYGKIQTITQPTGVIAYTYDAGGNRISKTAAGVKTIYVRDASGNVMSVYTSDPAVSSGQLLQSEVHLYGSSRLGIFQINRSVQSLGSANYLNIVNTFTRGNKFFELSNHLGNVLVTISDKKTGVDANGDGIIDHYNADVITASDYYPFGMQMPGRKFSSSSSSYRYGFNGKENDDEVKGTGNQQDYGMRIYDPRLGRFLSVDPLNKQYPYYTPYSFAGNKPIKHIDLDGLEEARNWMDYNFTDLMQWLEKPSNPVKDNGFIHSAASSFNRNFNPIYYGYVITTGDDPSSSDYGKMGRIDAASNLTVMIILHKSFTIAAKPSSTIALEQQMAKNEAAMGSSAAAKSVVSNETTAAASGQRANMSAQEIQNIKNYIAGNNNKSSAATIKLAEPYDLIRTETIGGNKAARTVGENIKILNNGGQLAPLDVASINDKLYVIDGHHRLEAAIRTGTKIRYNVLTTEQLKAKGYNSNSDVIQAASEVGKVKIDSRIVNIVATGSN